MSLIRLIENLSFNKNLSNLPEIIYDKNGRYVKLNQKKIIHDIIQQRTISGYFDNSRTKQLMSLDERKEISSELLIKEQYNSIANQFNLSSLLIEKQYKLALKNRIEIPPTLMHQILIDAIKILYLIINQFNDNNEKFSRILKHLMKLENYKKLFDQYC